MKGNKLKFICFALVFTFLSTFMNVKAFSEVYQPNLTIDAKSAILIEPVTGKVLFEQNPDERLALASVTKVMTILLIYEAMEEGKFSLDDAVTVSENAAQMGGSQIFLEPFETQNVRDLLKSIIIASANDAAVAMAEFVAGSEESFVSMMNKKAVELSMNNTSFKNACGLDAEGHFSSARDISIMSRELITKYPQVFEYSTIWQDTITHKTARGEEEFGLTNTNKLIKWYKNSNGLKTGSTGQAKYCLSGTAERDGLKLISVILAAPSPTVRFQEVMKMLDYGFANFKIEESQPVGTVVGSINVTKGRTEQADLAIKDVVSTVIPKGNSQKLEPEIIINDSLKAPAPKGTKAGEIIYRYDGVEIGRSDLITVEDIETASYIDILERLKSLWFE